MSTNDPLPDFYAILQVHPSAEPEIIEAAYRRLMRKYHPDALSPEKRQDPELIGRVRAINTAYDVLSDPVQRAAYDALIARTPEEFPTILDPDVEMRIHLVRCAKTRETFRMLLGRKSGSKNLFRVLGFESHRPPTQLPAAASQTEAPPALLEPAQLRKGIRHLLNRLKTPRVAVQPPSDQPIGFPSQAEVHAMFNEESIMNFGDIDFGGWKCPACGGVHRHTDGTPASWCRCSACMQIYCAGSVRITKLGELTSCPWCGRRARITTHIHPGERVDMPVKGEVSRSAPKETKQPKLDAAGAHRLPDKRKEP